MWKTINRVLEKDVKSTNISTIESEGKTLTKEYDVLEALNRPFVSVGPDLAKKRLDPNLTIYINDITLQRHTTFLQIYIS